MPRSTVWIAGKRQLPDWLYSAITPVAHRSDITKTGNKGKMRRLRNVKIVATLGPASSDYDTIRALFEAGADVFRLNMSHGTHDDIRARHEIIRQVEADVGRPIGILADLQGPKLRVGRLCRTARQNWWMGRRSAWTSTRAGRRSTRVNLPHPEIFAALEPGRVASGQ